MKFVPCSRVIIMRSCDEIWRELMEIYQSIFVMGWHCHHIFILFSIDKNLSFPQVARKEFEFFASCKNSAASYAYSCRDTISSLNVQVLYCERAIEVLLPFAVSNIYFTQTFIQSNTQGAEVLTTCRLHLELNFINLPFYLKAFQVTYLSRCWCMSRHNYSILLFDCDAYCFWSLSLDALKDNYTSSGTLIIKHRQC